MLAASRYFIGCLALLGCVGGAAQLPDTRSYITVRDGSVDRESILLLESQWARLALIADLEEMDPGKGRLLLTRLLQITATDAATIAEYALAGVKQRAELDGHLVAELCMGAAELVTRPALAAAENEIEQRLSEFKGAYWDELGSVVDASTQQRMNDWADQARANMTIASSDLALMFEVEQLDPKDVLKVRCGLVERNEGGVLR